MPKFQKGDAFIYTKEMNEAKKKVKCYPGDNKKYIGKKMEILEVGDICSSCKKPFYSIANVGIYNLYHYCEIDDYLDHLPTTASKKKPRIWTVDTTVKSDDGIEISPDNVKIVRNREKCMPTIWNFTPKDVKELYKKLGASLKIHKRYFNN